VEVSFASRKLQKVCESEKELRRAYGTDAAKKVMSRLSDLRAATTLEDMRNLPGRCHELAGDRAGQLAIELAGGRRLVIQPANGWPSGKAGGAHVWGEIDAVQVLEIVDYHDG
jgi:plasmid maintenance system killer protein